MAPANVAGCAARFAAFLAEPSGLIKALAHQCEMRQQ